MLHGDDALQWKLSELPTGDAGELIYHATLKRQKVS